MDIHDVSGVPQFGRLLQQQQQSLRDGQSRKGQRPRATKSRSELVLQFQHRLMMRTTKGANNFQLRSSFVPPAYSPCTQPFSTLAKVMIEDLLLETHHRGKYLLLRSITPPDRMTAIMAVVEDENNDVVMLQLYHREEEEERAAREIMGEGTVLIIKEPYLKLMSDGDYGLRVDHFSDFIHLRVYDERVPRGWRPQKPEQIFAASSWKAEGNSFFNESKYHIAIELYVSQGLFFLLV